MVLLIHNNQTFQLEVSDNLPSAIEAKTGLPSSDYFLTQNGKRIFPDNATPVPDIPVRIHERLPAGKGGFGSMLRAIGAQIEKTTNREACRDLSGRRLRDINEEKRLKAYLDKQREADPEDEQAKLQKKVEKLLAKPRHEFHDEGYNQARTDLTQNVDEAVQEGLKRAAALEGEGSGSSSKRKAKDDGRGGKGKKKKAKGALWLGADDLGSSSDDDDEDDSGSDSGASGASSSGVSSEKKTVGSEEEEHEGERSNQEKAVEAASG